MASTRHGSTAERRSASSSACLWPVSVSGVSGWRPDSLPVVSWRRLLVDCPGRITTKRTWPSCQGPETPSEPVHSRHSVHLVLRRLGEGAYDDAVDVDVMRAAGDPRDRLGDVVGDQRAGHTFVHLRRTRRVAAVAGERELLGHDHARYDLADPDRLAAQLEPHRAGDHPLRGLGPAVAGATFVRPVGGHAGDEDDGAFGRTERGEKGLRDAY